MVKVWRMAGPGRSSGARAGTSCWKPRCGKAIAPVGRGTCGSAAVGPLAQAYESAIAYMTVDSERKACRLVGECAGKRCQNVTPPFWMLWTSKPAFRFPFQASFAGSWPSGKSIRAKARNAQPD